MDANEAQETSERDQLWASLRPLRAQIDRLTMGEFDGSEWQRQLVTIIARIVAAEMDYRSRESKTD